MRSFILICISIIIIGGILCIVSYEQECLIEKNTELINNNLKIIALILKENKIIINELSLLKEKVKHSKKDHSEAIYYE